MAVSTEVTGRFPPPPDALLLREASYKEFPLGPENRFPLIQRRKPCGTTDGDSTENISSQNYVSAYVLITYTQIQPSSIPSHSSSFIVANLECVLRQAILKNSVREIGKSGKKGIDNSRIARKNHVKLR